MRVIDPSHQPVDLTKLVKGDVLKSSVNSYYLICGEHSDMIMSIESCNVYPLANFEASVRPMVRVGTADSINLKK